MTFREGLPKGGSSDILATLGAAGMVIEYVEPDRRLVVAQVPGHDAAEFVSPRHGGMRFLAVPQDSHDAAERARLEAHGVPVLQEVGQEQGIGLWLVPPGTYSVGASAHLIAGNPVKYGGLLRVVGEVQRRAVEAGIGVTAPLEGVRLVDRFAFAPDLRSPGGVGVYMIPPYAFDPDMTPDAFAEQVTQELAATRLLEPDQLAYLSQQVGQGVGGGY